MINSPFSLRNKNILVIGQGEICDSICSFCRDDGAVVLTEELVDDIDSFVNDSPLFNCLSINIDISQSVLSQYLSRESMIRSLNSNVINQILLVKSLLKKKKLCKGGAIVFTSSLSGIDNVHYADSLNALSAGAISSIIKCLALEFASKGIRVNHVRYGVVMTNELLSNQVLSPKELEEKQKFFPLRRFGKPIDVAGAVLFLLSDASTWITGTSLRVDGGYSVL
ncbi:SDR family NAD(P)-dependent oxidoreductase [Bacteroides oleiciplenus]|uniref:SDR family NAD(P)-dependent oxidoreductase n=1 Tax=Bacteroides oleiciplenus TaxID=626931 RepID=UPI0026DCEABC|nr:SDR family oxidoreductase [Bacteroides oleiciplenus]